jgi:hypothetical protein
VARIKTYVNIRFLTGFLVAGFFTPVQPDSYERVYEPCVGLHSIYLDFWQASRIETYVNLRFLTEFLVVGFYPVQPAYCGRAELYG